MQGLSDIDNATVPHTECKVHVPQQRGGGGRCSLISIAVRRVRKQYSACCQSLQGPGH